MLTHRTPPVGARHRRAYKKANVAKDPHAQNATRRGTPSPCPPWQDGNAKAANAKAQRAQRRKGR
ncbi:MAG: hypothetical protein KatS3mg054_0905 [Chloroflexus sp.]|nr:MAG: hypothetical protein KatS3mg054_0905 [Chloroflexus sp.]